MEVQRISAEELRKSIKENKKNHEHSTIVERAVESVCVKIGNENFAYVLMIISQVFYPLGFLYSNEHKIHPIETNLFRGMMVTILSVIVGRYFNLDLTYRNPHNFKILLVRNFFTCVQAFGYTIVQFYLPQPIVQTLNSTGPLFVFLLDYKLNGIQVTKRQLIGILLGIGGVLLTINGELIMHLLDTQYESSSKFENYKTSNPKIQLLVGLVFVFLTFLWAYAQILTKRLVGANSVEISLHLAFYLIFTSGIMYPIQVSNPVPIENFFKGMFAGGLFIALSQMLYFGALVMTKNMGNITLMIFVGVIVGYLVSVLRYDQPVNPISTIGSILIIIGLARIVLKQNETKKQTINKNNEVE